MRSGGKWVLLNIFTQAGGRDASGQKLKVPTLVGTVNVQALSATETAKKIAVGIGVAGQIMLRARYYPQITAGLSANYLGSMYRITKVENTKGQNRELILVLEQPNG